MGAMHYQTQDGLADYVFSIEYQAGKGWRVYIVFGPVHKDQDDSLPYQSFDNNGRRYVDWPSKFDSLEDAKKVAKLWAEYAQRYQRAREEQRL